MKLHKTLVQAVIETLQRIFREGIYADKAVEHILKQNSKWGSRDRKFIAENVYGMVRWWRLINESASPDQSENYMHLFAVWMIISGNELPHWEEFKAPNSEEIHERYALAKKTRKFRESFPDWLDELAVSELGEKSWEKEAHALNEEAKVVLRINTLKSERERLFSVLHEEGINVSFSEDYPDAMILEKRQNLLGSKSYQNGLFEVQDASSQLIAPFMEVEPGMTVIDACAGAGGKSLHIASKMQNKGKIISMDVEERKLMELKKRADRAGVKIVSTQVINSNAIPKLKDTADRLLLDVPCSGLGVLRRNPDAKWKLNPEFMKEIKIVQQKIISEYSQMVKPGGLLVYATCSILPGENQLQVEAFLKDHSGFEFISDRKVLPSEGFDGFYMAKIKRKN